MHPLLSALNRNIAISFSGILGALGATETVTGTPRTITGSGTIRFENLSGFGTPEYSYAGGAFTTITEGGTLAVVSGQTLRVRATGLASGQQRVFDVVNNIGGATIEGDVTLERS